MITSRIDYDTGILYVDFKGEITLEDLLEHVTIKERRSHYPKKLKILTNATTAEFFLQPRDLVAVKEEMSRTLKKYKVIYDAFVVNHTKSTALSVFYMELATLDNYHFKVFSTKEAAENWLKSN